MAVIYLWHPKHGTKVASMEAEATYDEGNGWKRYDPNEAQAVIPDPEVNVLASLVVAPEPEPEPAPVAPLHPLDHDGDGHPGGSMPGPRRRRARQE